MAQTVFVTEAQVMAAQMLVERDRALGRQTDPATQRIAEARPARRAASRGSSPPAPVRFWEALDDAERTALREVASWETFAAGHPLMTEGDKGDRVIVILGGRAKISVVEDGRERVLAVRDLGQLVGERPALQVGVTLRSATVTALEMVWGLVINSEDFATFVEDHPRVRDIVLDQNYRRLTEPPPVSSAWPGGNLAAQYAPHRPVTLNGENYTVVLIDVIEANRTSSDRLLIREALWRMTAATVEGIPGVRLFDRGDGILVVAPPSAAIAEVMRRLLTELPAAIAQHNGGQRDSARLQLRLAINVGPAFETGPAYPVTRSTWPPCC